jgi:hypothetical protein
VVDPAEHRELFRELDLDLDAGDEARHGDVGHHEGMTGLPESKADQREAARARPDECEIPPPIRGGQTAALGRRRAIS